jgi:hypothetical protein
MTTRQNIFAKKMKRKNEKNGATLRPAAEKPEVVKTDIVPPKSSAHSVLNAKNGAFLAHLELEM